MPFYRQVGSIPAKRHIQHKVEPGFRGEGLYYEEVVTLAGFGRAYSIVYHLRPPTRVKKVEPLGDRRLEKWSGEALRHHHFRTKDLPRSGDVVSGRVPILFNDDVTLSRCRPAQPQAELYRNATDDEVLFVHEGSGILHTQFGPLRFRPFDYVVVPRCTTYRVEAEADLDLLVVEAAGNIEVPKKYINRDGQMRLGAPYCERDLHGPAEVAVEDREEETTILVKDGARWSRYVMANHPFDVVGWDGIVYPYTFNADDFEPITGTIHQPPPIHLTFEAPGFVLCTFAPRLLDTHPEAVKVPYAHSNVQADEVLYYVRGNFGSRRGIDQSSISWHPRGIPHGPHPGTIVASRPVTRTDELAVMVDTVGALFAAGQAMEFDDPLYPYSWLE